MGFPSKLYLYDLKRDFLPADAIEKLPLLERLDYKIRAKYRIVRKPRDGENTHSRWIGIKDVYARLQTAYPTSRGAFRSYIKVNRGTL